MNITLNWQSTVFYKDHLPRWTCPTCNDGKLVLNKERFVFDETATSKADRSQADWYWEWIRYRFVGLLICSNNQCGECVSFSGIGSLDSSRDYDEHTGIYTTDYSERFEPSYFYPPLNLFKIPDTCPSIIRDEIISAFGLFWQDASACANRIRIALELLMTDQRVKQYSLNKGKRHKLTLHSRLERYKLVKPEIADHLLAIKWIGNSGSHTGKIEKIDLLDAFELLDYSLTKIYNNREKYLQGLVKSINKVKGPLAHKTKPLF